MAPQRIIHHLTSNQEVFRRLLENTSVEEYTFRPDARAWCLLEVTCHLLDEEVEDFRARVNHVLMTPDVPLKPISPEKWPIKKLFRERF